MTRSLHLYEDSLGALQHDRYPGDGPRAIYVVSGALIADGQRREADDGILGAGSGSVEAGDAGAACWRFELAPSSATDLSLPGGRSKRLLAADLTDVDFADDGGWFLRLDSVAFPAGGCALLHTHQGPGIRCLLEGSIRIDTDGHSTHYRPGEAWFEAGPVPVFAAADPTVPSRFIRASVLPGRLAGRSSIQYVREEDRDAPKSQSYRGYGEQVI